MSNILLAIRNQDLADDVRDRLEVAFIEASPGGRGMYVDIRRNAQAAYAAMRRHRFSIVVVDADIPADPTACPDAAALHGVELAETASEDSIPAIVLTTSSETEVIRRCSAIANAIVVAKDAEDWQNHLIRRCLGSSNQTDEQGGRIASVDITASDAGWNYLISTGDRSEPGSLVIDRGALATVSALSAALANGQEDTWEPLLQSLGQNLVTMLFRNNRQFEKKFQRLLGTVQNGNGALANVSIAFRLPKNAGTTAAVHDLVLEALYDDDEYWMLQSPIYRRVGQRQDGLVPFVTNRCRPLNVLIIESSAHGVVEGLGPTGASVRLERLRNVPFEAEWLSEYLKRQRSRPLGFKIGRVETVSRRVGEQSFWERVREVAGSLHDEVWDIVHYAGHSYYEARRESARMPAGYVFFPGVRADTPQPIPIEQFSYELGRPAFVYLSSCRSSRAPFVLELAAQNTGAIVGFRWDIDDEKAAEFAKTMYEQLFEHTDAKRPLQCAFLQARRTMYNQYRNDKIWAAPVLVMSD